MIRRLFSLANLRILIIGLTALAGLLPILGWLGGGFWFFDLFNHFQFQYAVFFAMIVVTLLCLKSWRGAVFAALLLMLPLLRIIPAYVPPAVSGAPPVVRVAAFNVLATNKQFSAVEKWTREKNPDFIYFSETSEPWSEALASLSDAYPYSIDEGTGFAFYSKLPINQHEVIRCSEIEFPLLKARIQTPRGEVTFFGAHPLPPVSPKWAKGLEEMMTIMAAEILETSGPVIAGGDFNSTRWSHMLRPLQDTGLMDASKGEAPAPTWMRKLPFIAIPIDHLLFRGSGVGSSHFEIGPDLGSDHRPVVAEIGW